MKLLKVALALTSSLSLAVTYVVTMHWLGVPLLKVFPIAGLVNLGVLSGIVLIGIAIDELQK